MERKKINLVIVSILVLAVICLGSYVVYDKFIANGNVEVNDDNIVPANEKNEIEELHKKFTAVYPTLQYYYTNSTQKQYFNDSQMIIFSMYQISADTESIKESLITETIQQYFNKTNVNFQKEDTNYIYNKELKEFTTEGFYDSGYYLSQNCNISKKNNTYIAKSDINISQVGGLQEEKIGTLELYFEKLTENNDARFIYQSVTIILNK